jgi:hypothetical protein
MNPNITPLFLILFPDQNDFGETYRFTDFGQRAWLIALLGKLKHTPVPQFEQWWEPTEIINDHTFQLISGC